MTILRTAKVIAGFACLVVALLPGLLALCLGTNFGYGRESPGLSQQESTNLRFWDLCLASPFAVCAIGLVAIGLFLILKRNSLISKRARVLIVIGALAGVVPAVGVVLSIGFHSGALASNATLVQRIEFLQNQKTNGLNMVSYEQTVLRRRLVSRGYLVEKIYDMPNMRMETTASRELWDAMITFRDKECSSLANFGMGPADGSTAVLYVTVTDLPNRIPQWKTMLLKWDSGARETSDLQKPGPESIPSN